MCQITPVTAVDDDIVSINGVRIVKRQDVDKP